MRKDGGSQYPFYFILNLALLLVLIVKFWEYGSNNIIKTIINVLVNLKFGTLIISLLYKTLMLSQIRTQLQPHVSI